MAFFFLRRLWVYSTCLGLVVSFGCSKAEEDLSGVWISTRPGEEMRLEIRKDGTFSKTTKIESLSSSLEKPKTLIIRQMGRYRIENGEIVFYDFKEGLLGKEFTHIRGSIRIPFSKKEEVLIWYPGTAKKRAFVRKG